MSSGASSRDNQFNLNPLTTDRSRVYEFDSFRLDAGLLLLYQDSQPVDLAPKVVETLLALVERRGEIVSKDELMHRLWRDAFVEEANLTQNIYMLRKTLGTTSSGAPMIETFRRRGYRFNGVLKKADDDLVVAFHTRTRHLEEELVLENVEATQPATSDFPTHRTALITLLCLLLMSLAVWAGWRSLSQFGDRSELSRAVATPTFKRLAPDVDAKDPTISPDGKYLVFGRRDGDGKRSIYLMDLASGAGRELLPATNGGYDSFVFSRDGSQIYFLAYNEHEPRMSIERISLSGGDRTLIANDPTSPFTVSPDESRIAFIRGTDLMIAGIENHDEVKLSHRASAGSWFASWGSQLSWSPDGASIAICAGHIENGEKRSELLLISTVDGQESQIPLPAWDYVEDAVWLSDMSGILVNARERSGLHFNIWFVSYPDGNVRRLNQEFNDYNYLSLNSDSSILVAGKEIAHYNIWISPDDRRTEAKQITSSTAANDGYMGLKALPDGTIVYSSPRSGETNLWSIKADGSTERQLTTAGPENVRPDASTDGRLIAFVSTRTGSERIWLMDQDGNALRQLTNADGRQDRPIFSPDGQAIYFTLLQDESSSIWKVSVTGGEPVRVSLHKHAEALSLSPDGKFLVVQTYDPAASTPWRIAVMNADSGETIQHFDQPMFGRVRMTADSKAVVYIEYPKGTNLWKRPLHGGPPVRLTNFQSGRIRAFDFMPDAAGFVLSRGESSTEAVATTVLNLSARR